jgi:hypothetical protein
MRQEQRHPTDISVPLNSPVLETPLANFGTDAGGMSSGVFIVPDRSLYGFTRSGGAIGDGSVYDIVNSGSVFASPPTTLGSLGSANGASPVLSSRRTISCWPRSRPRKTGSPRQP